MDRFHVLKDVSVICEKHINVLTPFGPQILAYSHHFRAISSTRRPSTARFSRLWSNEALYCRSHVSIPLYDDSPAPSRASPTPAARLPAKQASLEQTGAAEKPDESVKDFFKRIDRNVRHTKKVVRQLNRVTE